jgi:hypothetical protein
MVLSQIRGRGVPREQMLMLQSTTAEVAMQGANRLIKNRDEIDSLTQMENRVETIRLRTDDPPENGPGGTHPMRQVG